MVNQYSPAIKSAFYRNQNELPKEIVFLIGQTISNIQKLHFFTLHYVLYFHVSV